MEALAPSRHDRSLFDQAMDNANNDLANGEPVVTEDGSSILKIRHVCFGKWKIGTWYAAPYPEEYNQQPVLYLCEFCLKYMKSPFMLRRHKLKCPLRGPPGNEIYRDGKVSVFEVDGRKNKIYCQNLCLLAKMFLDHKTLYYDVEPFLFYVMTESDEDGFHLVGYFSKEKRSSSNYNLSCILTLPIHQRKGYGNLLIDFSYLLSKKESKPGSPEKPLSDLGLLSYRSYWRRAVLAELSKCDQESISLEEIQAATSMAFDDIVSTLANLDFIVRGDDGTFGIRFSASLVEDYLRKLDAKGYPVIKPQNLRWTPFFSKKA